jgi:hypothetical protein
MPHDSQTVYIQCRTPQRAAHLMYAVLGLTKPEPPFDQWGLLPVELSDQDPRSVNVAIPHFQEDHLASLRRLPGILEVGTYAPEGSLPDPWTKRREILSTRDRDSIAAEVRNAA